MGKYTLQLLLVLIICSEYYGKEVYLITIPNSLLSETTHQINVYVSSNAAMVIETVHPKSNIKNRSDIILLMKGIQSIPYFVPFTGPHLGNELQLRFLADNCSNINICKEITSIKGVFINESRDLDVMSNNFIIFSETDKPIYKPGDIVKLRAMAIYPSNLMAEPPQTGQLLEILLNNGVYDSVATISRQKTNFDSITIENPDNLKLFQRLNVSFDEAMKMSFHLSADPVFGKWKITIKLKQLEEITFFTVKKYVLPRFVVDLYPPTSILITDKNITVKICASYSTGKKMEALIRGKVCFTIIEKICRPFESFIDGTKKCRDVTLNGAPFDLGVNKSVFYRMPMFVKAVVTENGTTMSVTKEETGPFVKNSLYEIKFIGKEYFKTGLPYFGELKLIDHDGRPRANTNVSVAADSFIGNNWGFRQNFTSNNFGKISFVIPFTPNISKLYLRFEGEKGTDEYGIRSPMQYKNLVSWESVDKEFIQISTLDNDFKCPGMLSLKVLTNRDLSTLTMFSQVFARGTIQSIEEYPSVSLECTSRNDHLGHYKCVDENKIQCLDGWKGGSCREAICKNGCLHGACISPNVCLCKQGWTGESCEKCILPSYCVNGYCKEGLDCQCFDGWIGYKCDIVGPKKHLYKNVTDRMMTTVSPKMEPMFQEQTIFERSIDIYIGKNMGPDIHIVVFYFNKNNEVIADAIEVNKGLNNCSHLGMGKFKFNQKVANPRDVITLTLNPGTVNKSCALRISDAALSQFGKSSNVNIDYLISKLITLNHKITIENSRRIDKKVCLLSTVKRSIYWPEVGNGFDSRKVFMRSGLTPITNARVVNAKCRTSGYLRESIRFYDSVPQQVGLPGMVQRGNTKKKVDEIKKQIREFFPETWVFDYYNVTPLNFNLTVPDSMTSWQANSFCMTEKGIWISPTRILTVVLPFFVDTYVPYSIKIGERLRLPVKLFNYVDDCYEIKSTLQVNSSEINITGPKSFTACVCSNDVRTIYFDIKANIMGKLNVTVTAKSKYSSFCSSKNAKNQKVNMEDTIRRQLLVEPPGIQSETTFSELICNNKEQFGLKASHHIPTKIVPGSLRSYLVFNGDAMGQTFDNLDRLVQMPYGCGEQNMVALVPSIYVLDYLGNLQIEDPILVAKAKKYISEGYKRQLTYKHDDGSYSAFGKNDKSGSTWLTAFVLRSFTDASKYVSIDKNVIKESIRFLEGMQSSNGCFKENGKLLSSTMAGGLKNKGKTDEGLLTAYVLIGLKRVKIAKSTFSISKALKCVQTGLNKAASTYRMAISAYALSLHDPESSVTINLMHQLRNSSTSTGRYRYWRSGLDTSESFGQFNSADIETTGYALLALQNFQTLPESLATIYWLSNQRNSLGGYYSTQDTIVALNTIAVFAEKVGVTSFERLDLEVVLDETERYNGSLTKQDRLVTRKINVGSKNISYVSVKTNGTGCVAIQLISLYNIEKLFSAEEEFKIDVKATFVNKKVCTILKVEVCSSYLRTDRDSNMILITIDFPSGWELTNSEKGDLLTQIVTPLKRIDFMKEKIHLYYDSFSYADENNKRCFTFNLHQMSKVDNLKASFVRMVDYYKPEIYTDISYTVPMATCKARKDTRPEQPKQILCPKCMNNSESSVYEFRSKACPWSFVGLVKAGNNTLNNRLFFQSDVNVFYEWTLDLEPTNCSCLQSWTYIHDDFVVMSSRWMWLRDKMTFTNESTLFPKTILYDVFKSDLGNICSTANNLEMMLTRLIPDFKERTSMNETCPDCILSSNFYYKVKNATSFFCSEKPRWSLSIDLISSSTIDGTLSNELNGNLTISVSLSMPSCFCFTQLQNVNSSFSIIDVKKILTDRNGSMENRLPVLLDGRFQIVEDSVYSKFKYFNCTNILA